MKCGISGLSLEWLGPNKFLSSLQLQIGENKSAVPEAARVGRADHLKLVTLQPDDPLLPGMLLVMV